MSSLDGAAILRVADTGIGFNSDDAHRIFQRFYRANVTHAPRSGSGFGLTIAANLVAAQRETLTAKNPGIA